jgi:hypothetical protein
MWHSIWYFQDKWRNLSFGGGQGSRDKTRVLRLTGPSSSSPGSQALLLPVPNKIADASAPADAEKKLQDGKTSPKFVSYFHIEVLLIGKPRLCKIDNNSHQSY